MISWSSAGVIHEDGVAIDGPGWPGLHEFADQVAGVVLEVGLGTGKLHRKLAANPRVSLLATVERRPEIVERARKEGWLSPRALLFVGEVPTVDVGIQAATIFLDIPGAREPGPIAWALARLAPFGTLFLA